MPIGSFRRPRGHTERSRTMNPSTTPLDFRPKNFSRRPTIRSSLSRITAHSRSEMSVRKAKCGERTTRGSLGGASESERYLFSRASSPVATTAFAAGFSATSASATRSPVSSRTASSREIVAPGSRRLRSRLSSIVRTLSASGQKTTVFFGNGWPAGSSTASRVRLARSTPAVTTLSAVSLATGSPCGQATPIVASSASTTTISATSPSMTPRPESCARSRTTCPGLSFAGSTEPVICTSAGNASRRPSASGTPCSPDCWTRTSWRSPAPSRIVSRGPVTASTVPVSVSRSTIDTWASAWPARAMQRLIATAHRVFIIMPRR